MPLSQLIAIAAGGALGAVLRASSHAALTAWHGQAAAWSTLGVNVAGSFGLGLAAGWLAGREGALAAFLTVGLLGAFTTFSTFALDVVTLFRDRGIGMAGAYIGLSVLLSIVALLAGLVAARGLSA